MDARVNFDQTSEEFGIATAFGFVIYDFLTGKRVYRADFEKGEGANCIALLSDSNLVICSGSGGLDSKVWIAWDRSSNKIIKRDTMHHRIDGIVFRQDGLVVVAGSDICFYDCYNFSLIHTTPNPAPGRLSVAVSTSPRVCYMAYPSRDGCSLTIADYRDPSYSLGEIPVAGTATSLFAFDPRGELLAIVNNDGTRIQLWSVLELRLVTKFKRGNRSTEVSGIAFGHNSNFLVMTTPRGTMHVFNIPTLAEANRELDKSVRSKVSFDIPKGVNFRCQFDIQGCAIVLVSANRIYKRLRLEKSAVTSVCDKQLEFV